MYGMEVGVFNYNKQQECENQGKKLHSCEILMGLVSNP